MPRRKRFWAEVPGDDCCIRCQPLRMCIDGRWVYPPGPPPESRQTRGPPFCRRCQEADARRDVAQSGLSMLPEFGGVAIVGIESCGLSFSLVADYVGPRGRLAEMVAKLLADTRGEHCGVRIDEWKSVAIRIDQDIIAVAANLETSGETLLACARSLYRQLLAARRMIPSNTPRGWRIRPP